MNFATDGHSVSSEHFDKCHSDNLRLGSAQFRYGHINIALCNSVWIIDFNLFHLWNLVAFE